jgi:glyoxylase-like metal-dependent hydrolase (beta-lactamase superfamily II)
MAEKRKYEDPHFEDARLVIKKLAVGEMDNNVYILIDPGTNESVIVDCADEPDRILKAVEGTKLVGIWNTHGDWDHLQALPAVLEKHKVPVSIHAADAHSLPRAADHLLKDGELLRIGGVVFRVLHTPGHTPGGVCFYTEGHLIAGDTLFPGGPGNTKREGASFQDIIAGIRDKLFTLPDDTRVYPGHGLDTTIGAEKPHLQEWIARGW